MITFPNAKINIGLNITKKRSDGYHELETLMYPIEITDVLEINKSGELNSKGLDLSLSGIKIDGESSNNLVYKAYQILKEAHDLPPLAAHLHKQIPFGSGLGGGSADGSFMLLLLNEYFSLNLSIPEMEHLAAKLGSDCPFFIANTPAIASGRGELLEPITFSLSDYYIGLVIPPVHISTQEAYSKVKPREPKYNLKEYLNMPVESWKNKIVNDFEDSVYSIYPEVAGVKQKLYDMGAIYASLSGSGSSTFGIFRSEPDLEANFNDNHYLWTGKGV